MAALAFDVNGKILAFRTAVDVDLGAYLGISAGTSSINAAVSYPGTYDIPVIHAVVRGTPEGGDGRDSRSIGDKSERGVDGLVGADQIKCNVDQKFRYAGRAVAVKLASGKRVRPRLWMSLSGLPQRQPDRDTRGYFDAHGRRVWLDVYPDLQFH